MAELDVRDAAEYPRRGQDALLVHAVGGGLPSLLNVVWGLLWLVTIVVPVLGLLYLVLFPLGIAVGVFWTGYLLRVARRTLAGSTEPPGLDDVGALVRDGFWGNLVVVAYLVPGAILVVLVYVVMFASIFGMEAIGESDPGAGLAVGLLGILVMFVGTAAVFAYGVLAAYLLPASLITYADRGSVRAAFSAGHLKPVVFSSEYVLPWIIAAGVVFGVSNVLSLLALVLVGYLLMPLLPLLYFYVAVGAFYAFAQAYARETGPGTVVQTSPAGTTSGGAGGAESGGAGGARSGTAGDRAPEDV